MEDFSVKRNGQIIATLRGVRSEKDKAERQYKPKAGKYIDFIDNQDIQKDDEIVDTSLDLTYIVKFVDQNSPPDPTYVKGGIHNKYFRVYYETIDENNKATSATINIGSAVNLVIGTQQSAVFIINTIEQLQAEIEKCEPLDKPLLIEMISVLKDISKNSMPIKKGIFAKFADIFAKYSPIALGVSQLLLNILIGI